MSRKLALTTLVAVPLLFYCIPNVDDLDLSGCLKRVCREQQKVCFAEVESNVTACGVDILCAENAALAIDECIDELVVCASDCIAIAEEQLKN